MGRRSNAMLAAETQLCDTREALENAALAFVDETDEMWKRTSVLEYVRTSQPYIELKEAARKYRVALADYERLKQYGESSAAPRI